MHSKVHLPFHTSKVHIVQSALKKTYLFETWSMRRQSDYLGCSIQLLRLLTATCGIITMSRDGQQQGCQMDVHQSGYKLRDCGPCSSSRTSSIQPTLPREEELLGPEEMPVDALDDAGWDAVVPISQYRAHFRLQRVSFKAFVHLSCRLKLCVMVSSSTLSFSILYGSLKHFSGGILASLSLAFANSANSFRHATKKVMALSYRELQKRFTGPYSS